jgi:hypothetical protein
MCRLGLVDTLVMLTQMGFGQTSLSGVRRGFMPPQLKTKQKNIGNLCIKSDLEKYHFLVLPIFENGSDLLGHSQQI